MKETWHLVFKKKYETKLNYARMLPYEHFPCFAATLTSRLIKQQQIHYDERIHYIIMNTLRAQPYLHLKSYALISVVHAILYSAKIFLWPPCTTCLLLPAEPYHIKKGSRQCSKRHLVISKDFYLTLYYDVDPTFQVLF